MRLNLHSSGPQRHDVNDHDCERVAVLISRQIDGELAANDAHDLRMHLAVCAPCRSALDAQSSQSKMLSESLSALWQKEDAAALKKKESVCREAARHRPRFSKSAACAALAASILFFAATVSAPSSDVHAPILAASQPAIEKIAAPQVNEAPLAIDIESTDVADDVPIETDVETARSIPALSVAKIEPEAVVPAKIEPPVTLLKHTTLALLTTPVAPKLLPEIALTYSGLNANSAIEGGRATILGDVLNGKAIVRIETERGVIIEAAQADVDDVLVEPHRSAAKRLLSACGDARVKQHVEHALQKTRE